MSARFPPESFPFRVKVTGHTLRRGSIVEGVGPEDQMPGYLYVRIPSVACLSSAARKRWDDDAIVSALKEHGALWSMVFRDQIEPIGSESESMLALAVRP